MTDAAFIFIPYHITIVQLYQLRLNELQLYSCISCLPNVAKTFHDAAESEAC
jgi:hypothetical protein